MQQWCNGYGDGLSNRAVVSSNPGKIQNFLSVFFRLLMNKIYSRTLKNLTTAKYIKKIKK